VNTGGLALALDHAPALRRRLSPRARDVWEEIHATRRLPWETHDALARALYERAALPVEFPHPALLARAADLGLCPVAGLSRPCLLFGTIYYAPRADAREEGGQLFHETAEGLCDAAPALDASHGDVQLLTLALMAPDAALRALLRRTGSTRRAWRAFAALPRAQRNAPLDLLRLRWEVYLLSRREGSEADFPAGP
jgi:hypothetical protein